MELDSLACGSFKAGYA